MKMKIELKICEMQWEQSLKENFYSQLWMHVWEIRNI